MCSHIAHIKNNTQAHIENEKGSTNGADVYAVEPQNKGHDGKRSFVLYTEVSFIWTLKSTGVIRVVLSFIRSVLYQQYHCIYP